jgi:capsular polysaccharide export protein
MRVTGTDRTFLFLQGPHGPFFWQLSRKLRAAGASIWRVGFNGGDRGFWPGRADYIAFRNRPEAWPETLRGLLSERGVTDLVLYGDSRPLHAEAIAAARVAGVTVHCFEEGYLRPHWVTYERGGVNGHSPLTKTGLPAMRHALRDSDADLPDAPARWGEMRQHVFYGAAYHGMIVAGSAAYPRYRPHREIGVGWEFLLHLRRLALMPAHSIGRRLATRRLIQGAFPFHLVLLQLEHDASFRVHSPFATMSDFLNVVIDGFARGAPAHHHLVLKAHPLEDGRVPVAAEIRRLAAARALTGRVHFLRGGKLAVLLNQARSAVTVNSTAGQQALWRGLPLKVFGRAVYAKPEFVSAQPLAEFFARPTRPDRRAYRDFRRYLLQTSQVPGGFYSAAGRRCLLRQVVDMMLSPEDPYDAVLAGVPVLRQQLRLVSSAA